MNASRSSGRVAVAGVELARPAPRGRASARSPPRRGRRRSSSASTTVTSTPERAHTSAIPEPIRPPPTTPTRIAMTLSSEACASRSPISSTRSSRRRWAAGRPRRRWPRRCARRAGSASSRPATARRTRCAPTSPSCGGSRRGRSASTCSCPVRRARTRPPSSATPSRWPARRSATGSSSASRATTTTPGRRSSRSLREERVPVVSFTFGCPAPTVRRASSRRPGARSG